MSGALGRRVRRDATSALLGLPSAREAAATASLRTLYPHCPSLQFVKIRAIVVRRFVPIHGLPFIQTAV